MELKRGQVVKSRAGRDKDSYMAVLELDPPWEKACRAPEAQEAYAHKPDFDSAFRGGACHQS